MSRRPGIGSSYYEAKKETIYPNDKMLIPKEFSSSFYTKPPTYFDEKLFKDKPLEYEKIKYERRRSAQHSRRIKEQMTSLSRQEQNELEERIIAKKMVTLTREL